MAILTGSMLTNVMLVNRALLAQYSEREREQRLVMDIRKLSESKLQTHTHTHTANLYAKQLLSNYSV